MARFDGRYTGSIAVRTFSAICSVVRPAAKSADIEAKIRPTSSAVRDDTCTICRGCANPLNGSSLVTPFGKFWIAF
jgi:hypothetical protein